MKYIFFLLLSLCLSTNAIAQEIKTLKAPELLEILNQNKGKVIFINFFASWCPPCEKEVPDLIDLRKEYSEKDLLIIGLSVDNSTKALKDFLKKTPVNYPVYRVGADISNAYKVTSIPRNVVYNPALKAVYNDVGLLSKRELKRIVSNALK